MASTVGTFRYNLKIEEENAKNNKDIISMTNKTLKIIDSKKRWHSREIAMHVLNIFADNYGNYNFLIDWLSFLGLNSAEISDVLGLSESHIRYTRGWDASSDSAINFDFDTNCDGIISFNFNAE